MSNLSQLERYRLTVEHVPHSSFLYYAGYTPALLEKMKQHTGLADADAIAKHFGAYTPVTVMPERRPGSPAPDFSAYFADMQIPAGAYINSIGVLEIPGSAYHFTRYVSPLRNAQSLSEIESFPYVAIDDFTTEGMASRVEDAHTQGLVAISWTGHMYESAWQMRGYQEFLMDMLTAPEMCECILDRICDDVTRRAIAAAEAGVDCIRSGDDVASQKAMMFDLDTWRRFIKSRWARVYAAAREIKPDIQIWYHSDGNIEAIIPELIDIGVTILNPVQPECLDPIALKREYGRHLVFDGAIGTQTTMPFGTPDEVRRVVRERKQTLGADGALILAPTHVLEPEVPPENVVAFFDEAGA